MSTYRCRCGAEYDSLEAAVLCCWRRDEPAPTATSTFPPEPVPALSTPHAGGEQ